MAQPNNYRAIIQRKRFSKGMRNVIFTVSQTQDYFRQKAAKERTLDFIRNRLKEREIPPQKKQKRI
jgi:hypothetical protein